MVFRFDAKAFKTLATTPPDVPEQAYKNYQALNRAIYCHFGSQVRLSVLECQDPKTKERFFALAVRTSHADGQETYDLLGRLFNGTESIAPPDPYNGFCKVELPPLQLSDPEPTPIPRRPPRKGKKKTK